MPSRKPKCIPVPFTKCLHEEEKGELRQHCAEIWDPPGKAVPSCLWGGQESWGGTFPTQMVMHNDPSTSGTGNSPESETL